MIPFDDTSVSPVAAAVDSAATFCGAVPAADTLPIAATAEAGCPQGLVPWPQADTLAASEHAATLWGWVSDWTEKGRETVASADASVSEVFGSASTLAGGGVPDAVTSGILAQAVGFQAVVLLLATLYLLLFYTNSSEVRMLVGSFGLDRNTGQRTLGKSGIFHTHFLRRCAVLGAMGLGVLSVKLCDEWLPAEALAGLGLLLRQGFCIGVLAAVEAIALVQGLVLWGIGQVTLSQPFIATLLYVKQFHFARAALFVLPPILLSALCPAGTGMGWIYLIFILIVIIILLYLREIHSLFVAKKISNLHWFLYLCTIETAPIAFAVLMLVKHS